MLAKSVVRPLGRWAGDARCQVGMRKFQLMKTASHQGFTDVEIVPYDIVHPLTPRGWFAPFSRPPSSLEHPPGVRDVCGTLYIWPPSPVTRSAARADVDARPHAEPSGSTSVVVPCHNEEMNVSPAGRRPDQAYDDYISEIVVVDDNSTDGRLGRPRALAAEDAPRTPRHGGRRRAESGARCADGTPRRRGRYILTMDCDFVLIVPELRDLFDVVAAGHEGAIGSRFSHESVLINYPFAKILANRLFHLARPAAAAQPRPGHLQQPEALPGGHSQGPRDRAAGLRRERRDGPQAAAWPATTFARCRCPGSTGPRTWAIRLRGLEVLLSYLRALMGLVGTQPSGRRAVKAAANLLACFLAGLLATVVIADHAPLWNDELSTYYVSDLAGAGDIWSELETGVEQTPFSFYLVTQVVMSCSGRSALALRLPEVLGFALMAVCLFQLVARRSSPLYGFVAVLLVVASTAYDHCV